MLPNTCEQARALLSIAASAIASADPAQAVLRHLPERPRSGRCVVFAIGKAAVPMAQAVCRAWGEEAPGGGALEGILVSNDTAGCSLPGWQIFEASHPVPDAVSEQAGRAVLEKAASLGAQDFALVLLSGGGSSLLCVPAKGLTLADKQALNRALLASGLDIRSMNTLRRRASAIKGGRLAIALAPARVLTLAISDVPKDDPAAIASGPTVPDPDPAIDVVRLLEQAQTTLPELAPPPSADHPAFANAQFQIIAAPSQMLRAAGQAAEHLGYEVRLLGEAVEGEARVVAQEQADIARALAARAQSGRVALISGGELTVTLRGPGRGGPNREFALALAARLQGHPSISALAMDTDGADGAPDPEGHPVAGAMVFADTLARARTLGLDITAMLAANDAGTAFKELGDALCTGYTGTNVNDLRVILLDPARA
ncbi:MAG: DUF4147 domain-containing protein [Neomegalonema sp.]|nr:DUF4147 domain-containing protein [Neomegalonema sp.]